MKEPVYNPLAMSSKVYADNYGKKMKKYELFCSLNKAKKAKALKWWNDHTDKEKLELSLKHYNVLDLNPDQIVFVWRRATGGEWAD